jgi:hypothetical protein
VRRTAQASQARAEEWGKVLPKAEELEWASALALVEASAEELVQVSVVLELVSNLEVAEVSVLVLARELVLVLARGWAPAWAKAWVEESVVSQGESWGYQVALDWALVGELEVVLGLESVVVLAVASVQGTYDKG